MVQATAQSSRQAKNKAALQIIDCDVHHNVAEPKALYPYLPKHYVEYIEDFGNMMPNLGQTNMPGKGARTDLWVDEEEAPYARPEVAIKKHLDVYDIDIAVLTGGPYAAAVHSNPDYAAAYCRAFNDWTIEHWLSADPRFRASIHIAPQDPLTANAQWSSR